MPASNHYDTSNPGSAVSNREELADFVTTLAPEKAPVTSLCSREKTGNAYFEWTADVLAAPSVTGVEPGSDQTSFSDKFSGQVRLGNYVVELRRDAAVTDWQAASDSVAAINIAKAEVKAIKELKRDLEANLCGTQDRAAGDNLGNIPQSRGLGDWIDSAGPSDVPSDFRTPSGSIHTSGALTETIFKSIITSIFRQEGMEQDLNLVADTAARSVISGFAETSGATNAVYRTVNQEANGKLSATVSYYESDHGVVRVLNMNPICAPDTTDKDTGYFIPSGMLSLYELLPLQSIEMPNLGGGEKVLVKWAGGLCVKHPGAFGKFTDVTA